jgi:hypothetical protein
MNSNQVETTKKGCGKNAATLSWPKSFMSISEELFLPIGFL